MKKANLLLNLVVIIFLVLNLFNELAFSAVITNPYSNSAVRQQAGMIQIDLKNQEITPNASLEYFFDWIGEWDAINFHIASASTGNITTANISYKQYPAASGTEISSEILTSGTPIVNFKSGYFVLAINNLLSTTVNVTGNILLTND